MIRSFTLSVAMLSLFLFTGCPDKPAAFDPGAVESVDVSLMDQWGGRQKGAAASTREPHKVEALVAVLRKARPTDDHKCADSGRITLHRSEGETLEIGILAGHNSNYYEFRAYRNSDRGYDMYRIKREPFLEAMAALGLEEPLDPGTPE